MDKSLTQNLTVEETLRHWPQTAGVFLRRRMACLGCAIAPFETLHEVSEIYQLDAEQFLRELQDAARKADTSAPCG